MLSKGCILCPTLSPCTLLPCLHIFGSSEPPVPLVNPLWNLRTALGSPPLHHTPQRSLN